MSSAPESLHLDRRGLWLRWAVGADALLGHGLLRRACRCGDCRRTGPPAEPIEARLIDARPAGAYGLQLVFDDGHDRGIYPWAYLRELAGPGAGCFAAADPRAS